MNVESTEWTSNFSTESLVERNFAKICPFKLSILKNSEENFPFVVRRSCSFFLSMEIRISSSRV